jgi:hypothetical protein
LLIAAMRVSLVSRIRAALGAEVGILFYTLLVGEGMGIVRAALTALVNPNSLWDVSFQLSFATALGLVLYAQPLRLHTDHNGWIHLRTDGEKLWIETER